jgi:hypothetical protein
MGSDSQRICARSPRRRGVELGVAQSRIPLFAKPTNSASLRKGALPSVPSQRPMGKHRTPPFVPCRSAGIKGPVERASRRVREREGARRDLRDGSRARQTVTAIRHIMNSSDWSWPAYRCCSPDAVLWLGMPAPDPTPAAVSILRRTSILDALTSSENRLHLGLISIVVAINQFTFAFGPTLLAQLQHLEGTYTAALLVCFAMEIAAAIVVVSPAVSRHRASALPEI